jgi:hypothetical protein
MANSQCHVLGPPFNYTDFRENRNVNYDILKKPQQKHLVF